MCRLPPLPPAGGGTRGPCGDAGGAGSPGAATVPTPQTPAAPLVPPQPQEHPKPEAARGAQGRAPAARVSPETCHSGTRGSQDLAQVPSLGQDSGRWTRAGAGRGSPCASTGLWLGSCRWAQQSLLGRSWAQPNLPGKAPHCENNPGNPTEENCTQDAVIRVTAQR